MKFPYTRYSANVLRPVIPVQIKSGERSFGYDLLIDSGADINVFGLDIAEALGIEVESGVTAEVIGATGEPMDVYIHPIELTVGGHTFTAQVAFMSASNPFGLAGQRGFFDQFRITFNLPEEELELEPIND